MYFWLLNRLHQLQFQFLVLIFARAKLLSLFFWLGIFINLLIYLGRETTDSYTIAASPSFGGLGHVRSLIYSSFGGLSKSSLDSETKFPLLSDRVSQKGDSGGISRIPSSWSDKTPLNKQFTGELPIGQGCSLTQTIFNGESYESHTTIEKKIHIFFSALCHFGIC